LQENIQIKSKAVGLPKPLKMRGYAQNAESHVQSQQHQQTPQVLAGKVMKSFAFLKASFAKGSVKQPVQRISQGPAQQNSPQYQAQGHEPLEIGLAGPGL
jgi:hypothetical protein